MASCGQVKDLFTAYLDGEAGGADRLILEQHVQECAECHATLESTRATAALLYEALSSDRLQKDLTGQVLGHLPEMDLPHTSNHELTHRIKHAGKGGPLGRIRRWLPMLAPALVTVLGLVLWGAWPSESTSLHQAGMVLFRSGAAFKSSDFELRGRNVRTGECVNASMRYATGQNGALILGLNGNSEIRVFNDTRLKVLGSREFRLESGSVHCDIGKGSRYFRISTPDGLITVFGTVFTVRIIDDATQVTVIRGEVQVENEKAFTVLVDGQQTLLTPEMTVLTSTKVGVDDLVAQAAALQPNAEALRAFHAVPAEPQQKRFRAEQVFVVETKREAIDAIHLEWTPDPFSDGHAGYDIYVSDNNMRPLFKTHLDSKVFQNKSTGYCTVKVPDPGLLSGSSVLHISVLPDYTTGSIETSFTEVALTSP